MKVLSYNIHRGVGIRDRRYELRRIVAVVKRQRPDICCLQEVSRTPDGGEGDDQPAVLADALGLDHLLYQRTGGDPENGSGNLILSRYPIKRFEDLSLRFARCRPRGAQIATLQTPCGPLKLANIHLGRSERERQWQSWRLLEHPALGGDVRQPTVIVGDTNDWRNNLGKGPFREHMFRRLTEPARRFLSFPACWPVTAVDKAFIRRVLFCRAELVQNDLAAAASSHLPVRVDLELG